MNVLITTLGKARPVSEEAQGVGRYRVAKYDFDGEVSSPTSFFGAALREHLEKCGTPVDRIAILGTSGSMWDAWLELDENLFREHEDLANRLQSAQDADAANEALLHELSAALSQHAKVPIECRLIPYGQTEEEQLKILQTISTCANDGDHVYMDVTHGLRHLPMLELQSAFLMKSHFETVGIYYGALDRQNEGIAPVVSLTGAMRINDWTQAIAILQETGNVAPLARLPGMEKFSKTLQKYQFFEQMNNLVLAQRFALEILSKLDDLPMEGRLFVSDIRKAFDWSEGQNYARRQLSQARKAFDNGNYLRAVILLKESLISAHLFATKGAGVMFQPKFREKAMEKLKKKHGEGKSWRLLLDLRNSFAHDGMPGNPRVVQMRQDENAFKLGVEEVFKWVAGLPEFASQK